MGDEGAGEPFMGIVDGGAKDYEGTLPSDTVSLSDSDSEDFGLVDEAEVDTISPVEPPSLDDVGYGSDEIPDSSNSNLKSPVQPFHLRGMSSTFSLRSQSIFDGLEGAAKLAVPSMAEDNIIDGRFKRPLPPPTPLSKMAAESLGRQSKPPPAPKSSPGVPDYVAHPERWTKYSLEGVSESSDKTNRIAAIEFLEGLKKKGGEQSSAMQDSYTPYFNQDPSSYGAGRIIFTKPTKIGMRSSERKRPAEEDGKKLLNTKQGLNEKSPKKGSDLREEDEFELDHLDIEEKKTMEEEEQVKLEDLGTKRELGTGSAHTGEDALVETVGFHGSKKRSKKHFRLKADYEEAEES
ncbi:protein TSSC4 [Gopherus flavomarginatus]|uniref:protein TSSC4 n=1 Tax=Gopherus flavomarginatus TaxID=286002 RepID=UPI0021CBCBAE|nr:protein TSSC4 [Gopherus flavomarginatus]XP_050809700.1 protein TSSC4 [Gopherus flavomarginatus]